MKEIRFIEEARFEFLAAVTYYEQIERGLGVRFRSAVEAASALAAKLPGTGSNGVKVRAEWRYRVSFSSRPIALWQC